MTGPKKQFPNPPPATRFVWFLDQESRCWREGEIVETVCNDRSKFSTWTFFLNTADGKTSSVKSVSISQHEFDFKYVKNRNSSRCAPNLEALVFINEPEMLRYLSLKYAEKQYYHRTGDVTLSLNPHGVVTEDCEQLVSKSSFFNIGHQGLIRGAAHPYETAEAAFTSMVADKYNLDKRLDQTIFVRGCSGSGKTENMKLMLQYLMSLSMRILNDALREEKLLLQGPRLSALKSNGPSSRSMTFDSSLEGHFAAMNTILESMGSACRASNSNSSRFARVVELGYASDCYIEDMSVETFLLETVRVHSQERNERNFHIFYELAAGVSDEFKAECAIEKLSDFNYTNQGGVYERHDKVSDVDRFKALCHALNTLRVSLNDQEDFLKCVAGILHMGNVTFDLGKDGKAKFKDNTKNNHHIECVCRLLMTTKESFQRALSKSLPGIDAAKTMPDDVAGALNAVNHLAKTCYQLLVQWIVKQYKKLRVAVSGSSISHACTSKITIVDVFANECLQSNSFMQFCINYCSERMHHHFVSTLFEKEQETYIDEGVEWNFIAYTCNREAIKMLEKADTGFFNILESEAQMPAPCDKKLLQHCHTKIRSPCFMAASKDPTSQKFIILHYAGPVTYSIEGFTDKNKLVRVTADMLTLFSHSESLFVASLAVEVAQEAQQDYRHRFISTRVKASSTLLQRQIDNLTKKASQTKQHWIIAVKPSEGNRIGEFDTPFVLDQIIGRGLVPLVALNHQGFSHQVTFHDFVFKFCDLVLVAGKCGVTADFLRARHERDWQAASMHLLGFIHITKEILAGMDNTVVVGDVKSCSDGNADSDELDMKVSVVHAKTCVFVKRAMYDHLLHLSFRIRILMIVKIQRHVRVRLFRKQLRKTTSNRALLVTSSCLAYFANVKFSKILRETNARVLIQRFARKALVYLRFRRTLYLIVHVQARVRGCAVRRALAKHRNYAVSLVQFRWRRVVAHRKFLRKWKSVAKIQRQWRHHQGKLRALLRENAVIGIQRRWRSKREALKESDRLKSLELSDNSLQNAVKEEFLAGLDAKLAADPLYLIQLLRREEEVARLTLRVEEVKKLTLKRCHDLSTATSKLAASKMESKRLQATVNHNNTAKKGGGGSGREKAELLQVVGQLQKWVADKEQTRLRSLHELADAKAKVTAMTFDAALHTQIMADADAKLKRTAHEFKDFEFTLVKTSKNASQVEYEIKNRKFELKELQVHRDALHHAAARDAKALESLKALCAVLHARVQANAPEIQLAEMQFGLQSLQVGVTKLFSKTNAKERLRAADNAANLTKAQKNKATERVVDVMKPGGTKAPHISTTPLVSFRNFTTRGVDTGLPSYGSFGQVGQKVADDVKHHKKSKVKNLAPPVSSGGHEWKAKYLPSPTWCMICKKFIQGITANQQHAFKCRGCKVVGHRDCCHGFKCQCGILVFDHDEDLLAPASKNDHMWASAVSSVQDKCDLCDKYIVSTVPAKSAFECRRCNVFGHRDCCAKFSCEMCGSNVITKRRAAHPDVISSVIAGQLSNLVGKFSSVPTLDTNTHIFKKKYLSKPTWCFYCSKFVVGLTSKQQDAVKCTLCKVSCHKRCAIAFNEGNEAKRHVCPHQPVVEVAEDNTK